MTEPAPPTSTPDAPGAPTGEDVEIAGPVALPGLAAGSVDLRLGLVGGIRADDVRVAMAAVGGVAASSAEVRQGSVGVLAARQADVRQGFVRSAVAADLRIEQAFVQTAVANQATVGRGSTIVLLAARRVEGSPRVLFDWRGALVIAGTLIGLRLIPVVRRLRR